MDIGIIDVLKEIANRYQKLRENEILGEEEMNELLELKKEITNIIIDLLNQINNEG